MKTCDVDDLAKSLRSVAGIAQRTLDREHNRLSTTIDVDAEGKPQYVNWECRLPSGDGNDRQYHLLKIPWESFYTDEHLCISEVSVEFGCTIKKKTSADSVDHYLLQPTEIPDTTGENGKKKDTGSRCTIRISRENDFIAETFVDEQKLEDFLEQEAEVAEEKRGSRGFTKKAIDSIFLFLRRFIFWS